MAQTPFSTWTMAQHQHWMTLALACAQQAMPQDVPVGAVLVDAAGQELARAGNRREVDCNPLGHAELLVIAEGAKQLGRWRLTDTILYVTLEPCVMCASAIRQARIPMVVFGAWDPVMGAAGSSCNLLEGGGHPGLGHGGIQVLGGVEEAACAQVLKSFFHRHP